MDLRNLEADLESWLRNLLRELLTQGLARLEVERRSGGRGSGTSYSIIPASSEAAAIVIYVENDVDQYDLFVGRGTPFEIPVSEGRYTLDLEGLAEVGAIIGAVVEGRFEETLWLVRDEVVKSVGRVLLSGRWFEIRATHSWKGIWPVKRREVRRYAPYRSVDSGRGPNIHDRD
jgi:hypothetical protein